MKYRKPEVVELSARMQRAEGQVSPNACVSGAAASGTWESCGAGTGAGWSCVGGSGVSLSYLSCVPGGAADSYADCLSGSVVYYYCENGSGGNDDPQGCNVGPSFG